MDLLIEFAKIDLGIACVIGNFVKKDLENGSLMKLPLKNPIPKRSIGFAYFNPQSAGSSLIKFLNYIQAS